MKIFFKYISFLLLAFFAEKAISAAIIADTLGLPKTIQDTTMLQAITRDTSQLSAKMHSGTLQPEKPEQQALQGKILFSKSSYQKKTKIVSNTELTVLQQKVSYKTMADFNTVYNVADTTQDISTITISIDKLNTEVETMGVQMTFSSDSSAEAEASTTFAKKLYDAVGKELQIKVNDKGIIAKVDTSDVALKLNKVFSQLYSGNENIAVGNRLSIGYLLPQNPAEGTQWKDSVVTENGSNHLTYKILQIIRDRAIVSVDAAVIYSGVIESNGKEYDTEFTGTQTGTMEVNINSGLVQARKINISFDGIVLMDVGKVPARSSIDIVESTN